MPIVLAGSCLWPNGNSCAAESQASKTSSAAGTASVASAPKIGEVTVSGEPTISVVQNVKAKSLDVDLRSPKLVITSARYDIAAPHITLNLKDGLVHTAMAMGGAEVHVRNPEEKQHSALTCTTANYFGATSSEPAHLHLVGPIRGLIYDPQLVEPLDATGDSCDIFMMPDGTNRFQLNRGHATVTPLEPAAKAK